MNLTFYEFNNVYTTASKQPMKKQIDPVGLSQGADLLIERIVQHQMEVQCQVLYPQL